MSQTDTHKYLQIDSLRGIASLQVMNQHVLYMLPILFTDIFALRTSPSYADKALFLLQYTPLHLISTGGEAVIFFFVLSGFVLFSSMDRKITYLNYTQYLVKRFFRLYIPYAAAILVSILCRTIIYDSSKNADFSYWFGLMWQHSVSWDELRHLLTFTSLEIHNLVTSLWSIEIEIKISVLIPLLIILFNLFRKYKVPDVILSTSLFIASFVLFHHSQQLFHEDIDLLYSYHVLKYSFAFIAGMFLYKCMSSLRPMVENLGKVPIMLILCVTLFYYCINWVSWMLPAPWLITFAFHGYHNEVTILASCVLILISFNKNVSIFLKHKYLVHLGNISFSLYLFHPILMLCCVYLLAGKLPVGAILAIIIVSSFITAHFSYKYFEMPVNNFGKKLAAKIKGRKQANNPQQ